MFINTEDQFKCNLRQLATDISHLASQYEAGEISRDECCHRIQILSELTTIKINTNKIKN